MPRRISEKEIQEIIEDFLNGEPIENLSKKFNFSKITISRHLKKNIRETQYKELIKKNNNKKIAVDFEFNEIARTDDPTKKTNKNRESSDEQFFSDESFMEIAPLNCEIENSPQKDLSSISINEIDFPKILYMVVDKKIELEVKLLKDYPVWQFLSEEELNRKTIEIYSDLKNAKRFCNKEQKVIKVPNTDVFRIVAPILNSRGISRIVIADQLIAL